MASNWSWQRSWDPLQEIRREVDRFFETFDHLPRLTRVRPNLFPRINIYETTECYLLTAELPGMAREDFELSITNDELTLQGQRRRPAGLTDERYRRQERSVGSWSRTIPLPDRIRTEGIQAHFDRGVLMVTVPRLASAKPRQITDTTGIRSQEARQAGDPSGGVAS